jgi:predicted phosphodiesterase
MIQKDLTTFLQEKQTKGNWLEIANLYHLDGTNKQKSDYVRRLWKTLHRPMFTRQVLEDRVITSVGNPFFTYSDMFFDKNKNPLMIPLIEESNNVLFIGDIHEPFCKEGYLEFCKKQYDRFNCNKVIFAGDIVDFHAQSFHDSDADGMSAIEELNLAVKKLKAWYEVFPEAMVLLGNHDRIVARKLFKVGLSQRWMKPLGEVLEVPNWNFVEQVVHNGILYVHGEGGTARKKAQQEMMSCCQGHLHSEGYVELLNGGKNFALQVGCGIDFSSYAFAYAKRDKKPILSCAVILDQSPILIPFQ